MRSPAGGRGRRLGVRHPPRQPRSEDTRARLLDAAIECFSEQGVAATSTASIARRAGVTRGAYLHHFGSREDLVAAAVAHLMERSMAGIEATIRRLFTTPPTDEVFLAVWRDVYPDSYFAGYEMMLLARHEPRLRRLWQRHSRLLARRRRDVLLTLFPAALVDEQVTPFLEGFADLFRGVKLMEVVRSRAESRRVVLAMAPLLAARIEALQALRRTAV
tara:strand:+ start:968 stop:1621 length:654 start_codon:yes stop_codon:yes gene_type:complete